MGKLFFQKSTNSSRCRSIMFTITCIMRSGGCYNWDYVRRLFNGVRNHTSEEFLFLPVSDITCPWDWMWNELKYSWPGWWAKMELFRPGLFRTGERVLYFDLDTVIVGNIDKLLRIESDEFLMLKPLGGNKRFGERASGIMSWVPNKKTAQMFDKFRKNYAPRVFNDPIGDQKYISLLYGMKNIGFIQDHISGIYSYKWHCKESLPEDASVVCFHGIPRPHQVQDNWVKENWA